MLSETTRGAHVTKYILVTVHSCGDTITGLLILNSVLLTLCSVILTSLILTRHRRVFRLTSSYLYFVSLSSFLSFNFFKLLNLFANHMVIILSSRFFYLNHENTFG